MRKAYSRASCRHEAGACRVAPSSGVGLAAGMKRSLGKLLPGRCNGSQPERHAFRGVLEVARMGRGLASFDPWQHAVPPTHLPVLHVESFDCRRFDMKQNGASPESRREGDTPRLAEPENLIEAMSRWQMWQR